MRQNKTLREDIRGSVFMSAGWLFADLLLVLAMLFLAANTMGIHPPPVPTSTPPVQSTPKQRVLEHTYCQIKLNDENPDTFSQQLSFAENTLEPQINSIGFLKDRQVGLAIAYGGVDDSNNSADRTLGISMADQVYRVLQDLARKGNVFKVASYFDSLFTGAFPSKNVIIDVYLIVRLNNSADTCSSKTHLPV